MEDERLRNRVISDGSATTIRVGNSMDVINIFVTTDEHVAKLITRTYKHNKAFFAKKKYIRDFGTEEPEEYWNEVKEKLN